LGGLQSVAERIAVRILFPAGGFIERTRIDSGPFIIGTGNEQKGTNEEYNCNSGGSEPKPVKHTAPFRTSHSISFPKPGEQEQQPGKGKSEWKWL